MRMERRTVSGYWTGSYAYDPMPGLGDYVQFDITAFDPDDDIVALRVYFHSGGSWVGETIEYVPNYTLYPSDREHTGIIRASAPVDVVGWTATISVIDHTSDLTSAQWSLRIRG